jgi:hypothetical protein
MTMKQSTEKKQGVFILPGIIALLAGIPVSAMATDGDILAAGTEYRASTYGPPKYDPHPVYSAVGGTPVDLNVGKDNWSDYKLPIHAPEDGSVSIATHDNGLGTGWGNSITWTNGKETLYLAHLYNFGKTGTVKAGEVIGYVGNTGNSTAPHLHIQSSKGTLILSGNKIIPGNYPSYKKYTSKGPISGGPGGSTTPDPAETPASGKLPDFITNKVILANESGSKEKYTWKVNETAYVHSWTDNIGKKDWEGKAKKILVPFYLSKGSKEDSHSTWVRVGREEIKKGDLDVKDKPNHEDIAFNIRQWAAAGYIYPGRTYNFVVCADRPNDQDNGDGDVKEVHKSNNCSTPAVFYVDYGPARNVDVMASNLALAGGKSSLQAGEAYGFQAGEAYGFQAGEAYGFQADISNIGTQYPWNGCRTSYEIKGPGTGGAWQKVADEGSTVAQLGPNSTHVEVIDESRGLKAPSVGGDYVFRACADYEQAIPETDESNNCTAELPVRVEEPLPPPPPAATPRIVITNPTHTDKWRSSSKEHDIKWERHDFPTPGNVKIEYSLDGGATWLLIDDSTTNDEKKHWEDMCDFHTIDTDNAMIRVTSLEYPEVSDVSGECTIYDAKECK